MLKNSIVLVRKGRSQRNSVAFKAMNSRKGLRVGVKCGEIESDRRRSEPWNRRDHAPRDMRVWGKIRNREKVSEWLQSSLFSVI